MTEPYKVCDKATLHVASPTRTPTPAKAAVYPHGVPPRRALRPLVAMLAMTGVLTGPQAEMIGSEMADAHYLHQIEYRWLPAKDFSPVATSMPSPESLRAWDSRIQAWVRHPYAGRPSDSVRYQVLPNGLAAMAWRYWDQRAAERAHRTRRPPPVSRVLAGQASVLTPDVAVTLCRAGLPDSFGPMPGEVPDGAELPTVSADALNAMTRAMIPVLDRDAAKQAGLRRRRTCSNTHL
jgi:hypothetical protein